MRLLTLDVAKQHVGAQGAGDDSKIDEIIERWSAIVESYLDRRLIIPATDYIEFHPQRIDQYIGSELQLLDWPVYSITTIHEDAQQVYGAPSLLVAGTDYRVHSSDDEARVVRLSGGSPTAWDSTYRSVRVAYKGGYASAGAVPEDIQDVVLRGIGLSYAEVVNKLHGVSSKADASGNLTRFFHARLTDDMKRELRKYRNELYAMPTGTRAA